MASDYGTVDGVGALVPMFSGTDQDFADTTRPTDTQLTAILVQMSGMVNSVLAQYGFSTPIASPSDIKEALDSFVEQEGADIVAGINGAGRFGPSSKAMGKKGRLAMLVEDVESFVSGNAVGWERLGATRTYQQAESIGYRGQDEGGDDVAPIFQRDAFGNVFTDWDQ